MADYFSFEDVMGELELSEEDLKRMVSEGELRAFRDENKMKFKKEDVESLKKGRITEPTIILPSTPGGEGSDETILDLDIGQETVDLSDDAGDALQLDEPSIGGDPSTLEITEADLGVGDEEPEIGVESEETFIEEDVDTGLTTEPLQLADETVEAASVGEEVTEELVTAEAETAATAAPSRRTRATRRVTGAIPAAIEEDIEAKRPSAAWTVIMAASFVLTAFSGVFFYDTMRLETGKADKPINLTAGIANWVMEQFWNDPEWTKFHERDIKSFTSGKVPPTHVDKLPGYKQPDWYNKPSFMESDQLTPDVPGAGS